MLFIAMQEWARSPPDISIDNSQENNPESMSRADIDSLEPSYGRKNEGISAKGKPPPPPPPPPPKGKFLSGSPLAKFSNRKSKQCPKHTPRRSGQQVGSRNKGIYAWTATSSVYWKLLVVLQVVLTLTDIMDDGQIFMFYQRVYLLYLFGASIVIIITMYIYTIHTKVPNDVTNLEEMNPVDLEGGSLGSLQGTLRRAYIKRHALATTNFHLRLGAVVFGIATLIYFGFEIAVHTTGSQACIDDIIYSFPIILVVLSFLQIHFLFVNSQVLVGMFRGPAQFCFAHLMATNVALWLRTVATQSATNWVTFLSHIPINDSQYSPYTGHQILDGSLLDFPRVGGLWWTITLPMEFERIAYLTHCIHNTTLGQMWLQATPFLIPFLLQFCVVSAAVFFVLWSSMIQDDRPASIPPPPCRTGQSSSCHLENKGIFIGLLLLVGGVVVLVMYLILRAQPQFVHDSLWVVSGTLCLVLAVGILAILFGFLRLQGVPYARSAPTPSHLDSLLMSITSSGPLLYSVLGLVVSISHIDTNAHLLVMAHCGLLVIQVILQNIYIAERWRRVHSRSGQQMVQVLLFANAALWLLDTFMTASGDSQRIQELFYGPLLWGVLSFTCTPLIALYRFHSSIQLYELWKRSHT